MEYLPLQEPYHSMSYHQVLAKRTEIEAEIKAKEDEFSELKKAITETGLQIQEFEKRISNAPALLASGDLTTNELLALQSELTTLRNSLDSYKQAREIQEQSLQPQRKEINELIRAVNVKHAQKIEELPTIFLNRIDKQALEDLLKVFIANSIYGQNLGHYSSNEFVGKSFFTFLRKYMELENLKEINDFARKTALELLENEA